MSRFRALVADDEPLARAMVADLLRQDPEIETIIECADARSIRDAVAADPVDIAFLDIEMPEVSGIEMAGELRNGPVIVFVTAFSRYATNAFDVEATDYVLKPFSDKRFGEALERAKKRVRERRLGELATQIATLSAELKEDAPQTAPRYLGRLAFKHGDRSVLLNTSDVIWIEAEDYYVLVHSRQGRHLVRATLSSLEERLDPSLFLRVHRAAIVNLDEIREVYDENGLLLVLSDGSRVSVSRSRRSTVEPIVLPRYRTDGRLGS